MGPVVVTADEIPDPQTLELWLTVNGVEKQRSNTAYMLFKVDELIADIDLGGVFLAWPLLHLKGRQAEHPLQVPLKLDDLVSRHAHLRLMAETWKCLSRSRMGFRFRPSRRARADPC